MFFPILLGIGLGLWVLQREANAATGPSPFEKLPAGTRNAPKVTQSTASSGRKYKVSGYPVDAATNTSYFVAQLQGFPNSWLGYVHNRTTGAKRFFQGNASSEAQMRDMMADFGVVR